MECKFCNKECKNDNSLRNHERLCKSNPDRDIAVTSPGLIAMNRKVECAYCNGYFTIANIKNHERACKSNPKNQKTCPVCGKLYSKKTETCSYACSNTFFRSGNHRGNHGGYILKNDDELVGKLRYKRICFRFHEKKCVVCGEDKIVAVHHFDGNHNNNSPDNLVPLCPTHHVYIHSNYANLIKGNIDEYVINFKKK